MIAAFNLPNLITIISTVVTLVATGAFVGRWLGMYPIEAAIINACHSAQIATRIGGAITVTAVLILLSRLV